MFFLLLWVFFFLQRGGIWHWGLNTFLQIQYPPPRQCANTWNIARKHESRPDFDRVMLCNWLQLGKFTSLTFFFFLFFPFLNDIFSYFFFYLGKNSPTTQRRKMIKWKWKKIFKITPFTKLYKYREQTSVWTTGFVRWKITANNRSLFIWLFAIVLSIESHISRSNFNLKILVTSSIPIEGIFLAVSEGNDLTTYFAWINGNKVLLTFSRSPKIEPHRQMQFTFIPSKRPFCWETIFFYQIYWRS